ncbi:hypothetical protein [Arthrobacter sp. Leaf69]|nr:hypothetical protein [Arthrobacter sp. Leaf69]
MSARDADGGPLRPGVTVEPERARGCSGQLPWAVLPMAAAHEMP